MFAAVCILNVSTYMCTIKNKMVEGFLDTKVFFKCPHRHERPAGVIFESSEGSTKDLSVSIDGTLVALQLY